MRYVALSLGLIFWPLTVMAYDIEDRRVFGSNDASTILRVLSTADTSVFAPVIESYLLEKPDVAIDYIVASSGDVMEALETGGEAFDLVISSAMNLQTKLANDGFALPYESSLTDELPDWAHWRNTVFAFTREPAAIVISPAAFDGLDIPETREDLMGLLRQYPERFRGRIGTYDVRRSGLGYLFATQDARTSETYWRLTEIMGFLDTQLYCCSSDMIDDVASGRLAVAYNVLGSYAAARPDKSQFEIIYPQDFTTVMLRTALIPRSSASPVQAGTFLEHILAIAWQGKAAESFDFERPSRASSAETASYRHIRLGPGLLVHLDRLKKQSFLQAWENTVIQNRNP